MKERDSGDIAVTISTHTWPISFARTIVSPFPVKVSEDITGMQALDIEIQSLH